MPELEIIMGGYSINTDQTRLGLCTVTLIRGEVLSIVDVAPLWPPQYAGGPVGGQRHIDG